ncbi:MAG: aminotransferase class V-fold PLP-dependent enzyme, partial [Coriobacteriia bacterium]|nr:aminotransferase class V-fold PLP-dependent enzyme [Coriobacteriia bacterium]
NLFVFPAQSNFTGVRHPLDVVARARAAGWTVVLDAAAYVPTSRLDLSEVRPDFVTLSFYKMFGYPTGAGALLTRHDALAALRRPWFAGGTITLASVQGEGWFRLAPGHTGFEDGTVDFLGLPAITIGLEHLARVGLDRIHERVLALTGWLLGEMTVTRHTGGAPLVRIFGPETTDARGATIAFYLLDPDGEVYDVERVERLAGAEGISLRTGCFCNPGDGEVAHEITPDEMATCFDTPGVPVTLGDCQRIIHDHTGKVPNTIRVSFGISSDFGDAWRFMRFVAGFRDRTAREL